VSIVYLQHENVELLNVFASPISTSSSNTTNIVTEGNSTFSNSTPGDNQDISRVIIIPNPVPSTSSNNSIVNNNTKPDLQNNVSDLNPQDTINSQKNNSNSTTQKELQRGEYKVDNNGIHYYNINNCSLVKGSSGIGNLSECEDAEREIQEELTG
jgi:hypothetical protein